MVYQEFGRFLAHHENKITFFYDMINCVRVPGMDGFFGVVNNEPCNANESTLSAARQCIESIVALMNTTTSNNSGHNSKYS